jgi:outer membrane protein assembly factor BamB
MSGARETIARGARGITVVALGAVLVSGSALWPMFRNGPARTGENRDEHTINRSNVSRLHQTWTDTTNDQVTSPVVSGHTSFVASSGTLFAFDTRGKTGCSGSPKTCAPLWTGATGGSSESYVAVARGQVLVTTTRQVVAFDARGTTGCSGSPKTCQPLWIGAAACEPGALYCLLSAPVIANGLAYVGVTSPNADTCCLAGVQAFDVRGITGCSGAPRSCTPVRTYVMDCGLGFSCEASPPAVANGVLYVASLKDYGDFGERGTLFAFDATGHTGCTGSPATCTPMWTAENTLGVRGSPAVSNGVVYVTDSSFPLEDVDSPSGSVRAFDAAGVTGCAGTPKLCDPLWTASIGPVYASPAVARGNVYVSALSGDLQVFDAATGAKRWTGITGHRTAMAPTVANNVVYVVSNNSLFTFDADGAKSCSGSPKTCASLRTVPSGPEWTPGHEVAVDKGTVYVGGSDALRVFRLR